MESGPDRVALFARLVCLQPAAGALLFGCWGLWFAACLPLSAAAARRFGIDPRRTSAALLSVPLLVPLSLVARLLFTGGKMSRLPAQPLLIGLTLALLAALCAGLCWLGLSLWETSRQADRPAFRRALLLAAGSAYLASKLNQYALPRLYDYLHGVLAAFTLAGFALALLMVGARLLRSVPAWVLHGSAALLLALTLLAGYAGLHALDQNQNVRVALLSPNMPHARALVLGIAPLLPPVDRQTAALAELRAAAARRNRAAAVSSRNLPVIDDAHVLLITVDALRGDRLGVHGYARNITPELDALARRGVSFDRAYAQAPHSSYSLCSLMTSEYLHETLELGEPAPSATLPSVLAAAGYHSAAFYTEGIFHTEGEQLHSYRDRAFGFALHEHQDRPAENMTDRVLTEVDRTVARHEPSTLFWVHYFDVHEPYEATTLGTSDVDRYDSELLATDKAIGRLVREIERRVHKPLVVVITSDHGEEFHDHGGVYHGSSLYEEQVHVPLILVAPGLPVARIAAPVESIDIAPTLLGLLGVEAPPSMRGRDLRGLALDPAHVDRGPVFSAVIHKKMVVRWPHKLIADLRFGLFELYDLERDPFERDNRADHDPERLASLRGEIYAWLDALAKPADGAAVDLTAQALEWGRLGDRRAVQPLAAVLLNEQVDPNARGEAARLLGKLADPSSTEDLLRATLSSQ
ncbi:MAG TPA: sulfatase-like hydrolase/transferase, partial [Polyangiales bacterium]|nr:sulfatase-like hydrolase/transferase [Polyangiales bacterium]